MDSKTFVGPEPKPVGDVVSKVGSKMFPAKETDFDKVFSDGKGGLEKSPTISLSEHLKRMAIPYSAKRVYGIVAVLESYQESGGNTNYKWATKVVKSGEELKKVREAHVACMESYSGLTFGAWAPEGINNEYVPIEGGPMMHNQYLYDFRKQAAYGFEMKNHNPVAKAAVNINTSYVIGKGIKIVATDEKVQDEWDKTAELNDFAGIMRRGSDSLVWCGEMMVRVNPRRDGYLHFTEVDPTTCWEAVTSSWALEPEDANKVLYYHFAFPSPWQLVFGKDPDEKSSEYIVNDILADEMEWLRVNIVPGEKRGRADLFSGLGWLKRLKDYLTAKVIQAQGQATFLLNTTISGSSEDVDDYCASAENQQMPPPGSRMVSNASVKNEFLETKSTASSAQDATSNELKTLIAVGTGPSPEMLGVGGTASVRATAVMKSEPVYREFDRRRCEIEELVRRLARRVIANGKERGRIPRNADESFEVVFPEMVSDDTPAKIGNIIQLMSQKFITRKRAAEMAAKEVNITSYDYDREKKEIDKEGDEFSQDTFAMTNRYLQQAALRGKQQDSGSGIAAAAKKEDKEPE